MRWIDATACAIVLGLMGCGGAAPSPEVRSARNVVGQARASEAARLEPGELREAERLLSRAQSAPAGSTMQTDLAYLAERQAMLAMAKARQEATQRSLRAEQARYQDQLEAGIMQRGAGQRSEELREVQRELSRIRRQLQQGADVRGMQEQRLREREQLLEQRERELLEARREAAAAQQRADDAMAALQEFADVRQEAGATIITLSGEVLFNYDQADLRPQARQRLGMVSSVLRGQPEDYRIVVEGHTDSRGSDEYNMELSQERAETVRQFLVEQGVDEQRISAVGRGEQEPIAENDSPENRAVNRRVEIILERRGEQRAEAGMEGQRRAEMRQPGMEQRGMEQRGMEQRGMEQRGMGGERAEAQRERTEQEGERAREERERMEEERQRQARR
jgi:outer membrane protein OmpA-like peptidoglycan-associated protein